MNTSRVILAVTLTGLAGLGVVELLGSQRSSPAEVVADARARFESGDADARVLVRSLGRALDDPRAEGDQALITELLLLRADILERLGDVSGARDDLERVLVLYRRGDSDLELRTARLEAAEGRLEEALARTNRLARLEGASPSVFRTLGSLELERAASIRDGLIEEIQQVVVGPDAAHAAELLAELCARDVDDRARRGVADELRDVLPLDERELAKQLLDGAEHASESNRAARGALAAALADGGDAESARLLVNLLREAGRPELASDLGLMARLSPTLATDPGLFEAALSALLDLGHLDQATRLIQTWEWEANSPSRDLCELSLEHLLAAGESRRMSGPLHALRATKHPSANHVVSFYTAMQAADRARDDGSAGRWESAHRRLNDYLSTRATLEPIPGGRALAHRLRAEACRTLGDASGEREDLLRALTPPREAVPEVWLRFVTADDYLRMASLSSQARNTGGGGAEVYLTQAISLAPERWRELMPVWNELGGAALANEAAFSFDDVYTSATRSASSFPVMQVGPNTLYRVAREHLARQHYESALVVSRSLIADYPGLVPAYDLMIEAQLARGSRVQVTIDLLDRMALTGPDEVTTAFLAQLGEDALSPPQVLERMRLDPTHTGRREVALHALEAGDPAAALRALGSAPEGWSGEHPALRLVRARALLALARPEEALAPLEGIEAVPGLSEEALHLALLACAELPDEASLDAAVDQMVQRLADAEPPGELALQAALHLLATGRTAQAGALLTALDARPETRGGPVLDAMALQARTLGDRGATLEALERAEPFFEDGRVELRRLVMAIEDRDWRDLPARAVASRAALGNSTPPWLLAALLLLEERLTSSAELASAGLAQDPRDPRWALLAAAAAALAEQPISLPAAYAPEARDELQRALRGAEGGLDPRELLGVLIAGEYAGWAQGVPAACADLSARGAGDLWTGWAIAHALESSDDHPAALLAYQGLATQAPTFGPAWDGWDRAHVELKGRGWDGERVRLRAGRAEAGAGLLLPRSEATIDSACQALVAGDRDRAVELLAEAPDGPGRRALSRLLGYVHLLSNKSGYAVSALTEALPNDSHRADDAVVQELIDAIVLAAARPERHPQALPEGLAEAQLMELAERFPNDPLPALAWCRLRADVERRNPALVVDVLTRAFESLRARTAGRPMAELRPGAARDWGEFLVEFAPMETAAFLLEDLASTPGDLDLWRLLARAVANQGRTSDAGDLYTAITTMSHDPAAHHDYAWFLIEHGGQVDEVSVQIDAARASAEEAPLGKGRLTFLAALSQLRLNDKPRINGILPPLQSLWTKRDRLGDAPLLRIGRAYVTALALRGQEKDRRALKKVLGELGQAAENDPYVVDLVRAVIALEPGIPPSPSADEVGSREQRAPTEEAQGDQPSESEDSEDSDE